MHHSEQASELEVRAKRLSVLSSLHLVQSPRVAFPLALISVCVLIVIILTLVWVPWQQTVAGSGTVTSFVPSSRAQTVESAISGRIVKWYVHEGAMVREGDTIALLQDINVNFLDPGFFDQVETSRDNILLAQDASIAAALERTNQAVQALEASRGALDAAKAELAIAHTRYDRAKRLSDSGLVSQREFESASITLTKATNDSLRLTAMLNSARQNLLAVRSEQERVESQARVSIAEAELRLGNAKGRKNASAVLSPANGQVTRILKAGSGQTVKEGEKLATIVPFSSDIAAEIYVSGMDAALVDINREVTLQFAGYPAFQFSGFPNISTGIFRGRVAAVDAVDDGKGKFRILVIPDTTHVPWAQRQYLRQGSAVTGWVLLNEVSLGYEVWRQLNGFPPQFPVQTKSDASYESESK